MYVIIREYKTKSPEELDRVVKESFVPLISEAPGFQGYYYFHPGAEEWASISIFDTQAHAEESNRLAAKWVKEHEGYVLGPPTIRAGEAVCLAGEGMACEASGREPRRKPFAEKEAGA